MIFVHGCKTGGLITAQIADQRKIVAMTILDTTRYAASTPLCADVRCLTKSEWIFMYAVMKEEMLNIDGFM